MATRPPRTPGRTTRHTRLLALVTLATALVLVAIFGLMVVRFRTELRAEIREKIIGRDAAVLYPVALQQLAESETSTTPQATNHNQLSVVLKSARQQLGMLAVAVFDPDGRTVNAVPSTMLFVELPADDYLRLLGGMPISRYHEAFPLDQYFVGISPQKNKAPVLEVLLPLHGNDSNRLAGFIRYYIDAQPLAYELAAIDRRIQQQTTATLLIGTGLIAIVLAAAYLALRRAQHAVAERNEQLTRANFELTLSAKVSALGQITSHLIHGLQGPVAGLRAVVSTHDQTALTAEDWKSAASYTERMQSLIQETVGLLGDIKANASYEIAGRELAITIRQRHATQAAEKGVTLSVQEDFPKTLDSHRGSLVCLIAANLIDNAIAATPAGRCVTVSLNNHEGPLSLLVTDEGTGIPEAIRAHLFEPGHTSKRGGSGLGLVISQLLARQIGAELTLAQSDHEGTTFNLTVPLTKTP